MGLEPSITHTDEALWMSGETFKKKILSPDAVTQLSEPVVLSVIKARFIF